MIKNYAKAEIVDGLNKNNLFLEVNFDENNKDLIKIALGDKVCVIKKDDLWNFVFSIVETDKQRKMIPISKTDFESYKKQHEILLQKDMKKGETVVAHCVVNVRQEVVDAIKREEEEKKLSTPSPYLQKGLKL